MAEDIDRHDFRLPSEKASGQPFNATPEHDFRLPGEREKGKAFNSPIEHDFELPSEKAAKQEALMKALREQKPTWQQDGLGIRGNPAVVSSSSAQLVWPSSQVTRRTNPELDQGDIEVEAEVPSEPQ
jgi:hypothetical protein